MTDRLPETENWVQSTTISRRGAILGSVAASAYALAVQPVEAAITTPADGLDAGWLTFPTGGIQMGAYRAKPKGKTKLPTIIVVQEIFGVHAWVQDVVRRFAKAGFYAVAPDLYKRQGDATKVADIQTIVTSIVSKVPDAQVMGRSRRAVSVRWQGRRRCGALGHNRVLLGRADRVAICRAQPEG